MLKVHLENLDIRPPPSEDQFFLFEKKNISGIISKITTSILTIWNIWTWICPVCAYELYEMCLI